MNPFKNKNSRRRFEVILILMLVIVAGLSFLTPSTKAVVRDQTISILAEKDSYVDSYYPTANNGGKDWLIFGDYILGWNEAYLFFNFSDKPTSWTKAEIAIDMYSVSQTFNVTASLINDTWNELTINYINKPTHREVIETFTVAEGKVYTIDVTNYIAGRNNISICLNASNYLQNGYVQARSREGNYGTLFPGPFLVWTYPEDVTITVTSPTSSTSWFEISFYTIRWTSSTSAITNVKIELYKGNIFIEEITSILGYTANDGEYEFYVSSSENYLGNNYKIKISDYDDSQVFDYSAEFSINIGSGTITVTNPTDSSTWTPGSSQSITWTSTGTITSVDIDIYKGNILMYYIDDLFDIGTNLWTIPSDIEQGTDWKIKVSNADNSNQYDWSEEFTIASSANASAIPGYDILLMGFLSILTTLFIIRKKLKK